MMDKIKSWVHKSKIKTPTVFQTEEIESGVACLSIMFQYFSLYVPLEKIRIDCNIVRDGSKVEYLLNTACKYGFLTRLSTLNIDQNETINFPCICKTIEDHYFVIESIDNKYIFINDPDSGRSKITHDKFKSVSSGEIIELIKKDGFKTHDMPVTTIRYLKELILRYLKPLSLCIICGIISFIPSIMLAVFIKLFIDYYYVLKVEELLEPILYGLVVVLLLNVGLRWISNRVTLRINNNIAIYESTKVILKIFSLPYSYFLNRHASEITFKVGLIEHVSATFVKSVVSFIVNIIAIIFFAIVIFMLNVQMMIIMFVISIVNIVVIYELTRKRAQHRKLTTNDKTKYLALSTSVISVMQTIKGSGSEREYFSYLAGAYSNSEEHSQLLEYKMNIPRVVPNILTQTLSVIILIFGSWEVMNYKMTLGTLLSVQLLSLSFVYSLENIIDNLIKFNDLFGELDKLIDVKNYQDPSENEIKFNISDEFKNDIVNATYKGSLKVENITYGYNVNAEPILKNINLTIHPGERIAIVGSSGSGKSTLIKLIMQIYTPWNGRFLFDEKEVEFFHNLRLSNSIVVADQEPFIFESSIKDNISMWDNSFHDDEIMLAAKKATLHEEVISLKRGYEEIIREGGINISSGQKQKIEIARALLRAPKLLMLDEATTNIDTISENIIMKNIWKMGCTVIVVSHKLSTIKDCDRVIVLEDGYIVQDGSHDSLLSVGGGYRDIVREQFS